MRIKIVESGWEGFSGDFGVIKFDNGISEELSTLEASRLGALVKVVEYTDEENKDSKQVGIGANIVNAYSLGMNNNNLRENEDEQAHEGQDRPGQGNEHQHRQHGRCSDSGLEVTLYELDDLAKIADKKGINGLREVAKQFDVRAKSIPDIIHGIMVAQDVIRKRQNLSGT